MVVSPVGLLWVSGPLPLQQRRQAATLARLVARRVFDVECATGRRAAVVDRTGHTDAHFAGQRDAARRVFVCAAHAHDGRRYGNGHGDRHAIAPHVGTAGDFSGMEVDTQAGAAGATGLTNVTVTHPKSTRQRHRPWPEARYFFSKGVIGESVA